MYYSYIHKLLVFDQIYGGGQLLISPILTDNRIFSNMSIIERFIQCGFCQQEVMSYMLKNHGI